VEERLRVDLLGQFRVRHGAAELPELDTPRLRALLGRLALNGGRALDRAALAFELWPDSTEPRARGTCASSCTRWRGACPTWARTWR